MRRLRAWLAAVVCGFLLIQAPAAEAAQWLQATTPRFSVYSDGSESVLKAYAEKLEVLDAAFWEVWGLQRPPPPPRPLPIYLVQRPSDLRLVAPGLPEGVAGFYNAHPNITFAMGLSGADNDYVVLHEYTHHLMLQQFAYAYPAWLIEGYAEYFMSARVENGAVQIGLPTGRGDILADDNWVPMADLLSKRPNDITPSRRGLYYAQSWALTHYLLSDPARAKGLSAYLTAVAAGTPSVAAMTATVGLEPAALERRLRSYLAGQMPYAQFRRGQFETPKVTVRRLPAGEGAALLDDLLVKTGGVPTAQRAAVLARVQATAARYPDEPLAQRVLARSEHYFGDKTAAVEVLKRRLAADPGDIDAMAIYADLLMNLGDLTPAKRADYYNEAGSLLAASFRIDPGHYPTLNDFALSRRLEPNYPSDNTLTAMLTAVKLAPQVSSIRLSAAAGLIARKRHREAATLLTPLTNSPHDAEAAEAARKLLADAPGVASGAAAP